MVQVSHGVFGRPGPGLHLASIILSCSWPGPIFHHLLHFQIYSDVLNSAQNSESNTRRDDTHPLLTGLPTDLLLYISLFPTREKSPNPSFIFNSLLKSPFFCDGSVLFHRRDFSGPQLPPTMAAGLSIRRILFPSGPSPSLHGPNR